MPMVDQFEFSFETAALMEKNGNLQSITINENGQTGRLPMIAGYLTAHGLSNDAALESITIRAARQLGLEERIGSLERGKDADIAVFTGDALLNTSRCVMTMIAGEKVFHE